jgi:hypothetical protein
MWKLCEEPSLLPQTLNLAALAKAFRKHGITGHLLLCDIDAKSLRKDFNIDNFGRRAPILRVIEELRPKSARYYAKARRSYPAICSILRDPDRQLQNTRGKDSPGRYAPSSTSMRQQAYL